MPSGFAVGMDALRARGRTHVGIDALRHGRNFSMLGITSVWRLNPENSNVSVGFFDEDSVPHLERL